MLAAVAAAFALTAPPRARREPLRDDFSGGLNGSTWSYMQKYWDAGSHGVVADNVCVGKRGGNNALRISANGDEYTGPVDGCYKDGGAYPKCATRGEPCVTKVGGGIITRDYYGPALFCARLTVFPVVGVSSALWTFHYWGDTGDGEQDELDIEFPGRSKKGLAQNAGNALFTNYDGTPASSLWDCAGSNPTGNGCPMWDPKGDVAHEACIDWHLGDSPRVDYIVDGKIVATNAHNVPTRMTQYNIAAAFPSWGTVNSSGASPFETLHMWVESVRIEPHVDEYAGAFKEVVPLYPGDGEIPVAASPACA